MPRLTPMSEIRDALYEELIRNHGFEESKYWRTPGTVSVVVKDDVEVTAVDFPRDMAKDHARVRVDIHVPVDAREDMNFSTRSCGGREFLSQRASIVLRELSDIQNRVGEIVDLAQRGSAIIQLCGLELHEYLNN